MANEGRGLELSRLYQKRVALEATLVTAEAFGLPSSQIMSNTREKATIVMARQLAMYLAHVVGQMSLGQVSSEFGRDRTTVGYSCRAIEDRRDSPMFDRQIDEMEAALRERLTTILTQSIDYTALERKSAFG